MTLAGSIVAAVRRLTTAVTINGGAVIAQNPKSPSGTPGIGTIRITRGFVDERVPRCEFTITRVPTRYDHAQPVTVDLGYDGFTARRFTGTVESPSRGIGSSQLTAVGNLWRAYRGVDVPEADVSGLTIKQAIEGRLNIVGITNYSVDASLDYVLGSVVPAKLPAGPIADQIEQLMDIRNAEIYELSTGQVVVRVTEFEPAPTASGIVYDSETQADARILAGSDREDWNYFRDRVVADGATVPDGDPADPDTTSAPLHAEAQVLNSPLAIPALGPDCHETATLQQPLIDTQDELDAYALRKLARFARVPRYATLELNGDPTIEPGQTRAFNLPLLDVSGRWFIYSLEESVDNSPTSDGAEASGYRSTVTLRGGDRGGGTLAIVPTAAFIASVVMQAFEDQVYAIVTLDGSASMAPDGEIVSWDWSGDVSGSGEVLVVAIAADFGTEISVTLTVTASNTLTDARTEAVSIDPTVSTVRQPAVFAASGPETMATPDGGITWYDAASASAQAVDCKPPDGVNAGIAVYGFDDGRLEKTTDFNQSRTVVLAADGANAGINDVWWDKNLPSRVWAATATGRLLVSSDDGDTWSVYKDFGGAYPLNRIATPQPGGVWVFGGRGDVPGSLVQYDPNVGGTWFSVPIGGELAADLASATAALTVAVAWSRAANYLGIVLKGELAGGGANVFFTSNVFDGSLWRRATGLDGGLSEGRVGMPDFEPNTAYVMFENQDVWYVDTSTGVPVCTKGADFLPAGFTPNHGLWEGEFLGGLPGVHLIAAEDATGTGAVYKSLDAMLTRRDFRPLTPLSTWPAGDKCKMVAIGIGSVVSTTGQLVRVSNGSPDTTDALLQQFDGSAWSTLASITDPDDTGNTDTPEWLMRLASGNWLFQSRGNGTVHGGLYHSPDGVTFTKVLASDDDRRVLGFDIDSAGTIWALLAVRSVDGGDQSTQSLQVWNSTDGGASFGLDYDDAGWDTTNATSARPLTTTALVCDKSNSGRVFVACGGDGSTNEPTCIYRDGTGWHRRTSPAMPGDSFSSDFMQYIASGRILYIEHSPANAHYSDDQGGAWSDSATDLSADDVTALAPYWPDAFNNAAISMQSGKIFATEDAGGTFVLITTMLDPMLGLDYDAVADRLYTDTSISIAVLDGFLHGGAVETDLTPDPGHNGGSNAIAAVVR